MQRPRTRDWSNLGPWEDGGGLRLLGDPSGIDEF